MELRPCVDCGRMNPIDTRFCPVCGAASLTRAETTSEPGSDRADPLIGTIVADRYRIVSHIGRGGMGVVYKAEHVRIGKLVAIKLLSGELAREKDTVKRFKREAEMASKLSHPNTVQIFDFGRSELLMYLVMEYISGRDLGWVVQHKGPIPFDRAARIVEQICASVSEAHAIGLIHRDLKPENVMVSDKDFVKVLDFGLAKLRDQEAAANITRAGALVGTPYYMAPEQIQGEPTDARTDIYSIGALLYKIVAGVPAFTANSPVGVLTKHITEPLIVPSRRVPDAAIPTECDAIVARAMEKNPAHRYQRVEDLRDDLLAYLASIASTSGTTTRNSRVPVIAPAKQSRTTAHGEVIAIATRRDVDRYERRLRRRSVLGYIAFAATLIVASAGGVYAWRTRKPPIARVELEPNNEPAEATPLARGVTMTAYLGKRISQSLSDADVYALNNPGAEQRYFRVDVSAIPNMDLVVDVVRAGNSQPVLRADSGGVGEPESIPNFVFEGNTYYLRVREFWHNGVMPTENVSDPYTIRWDYIEPGPEDEREVNDTPELANEVNAGTRVRGYIGWSGDVDTFCLAENAKRVRAVLDPVEDLDLVVATEDRVERVPHRVDMRGIGEGESTPVIEEALGHNTCFVVTASTDRGGKRANGSVQYVLHIQGNTPAK